MARTGGEPLQQEFNRGFDFILNTYGSAENIMPGKNTQILMVKGIVIDIDFNVNKNYKLAAAQPPFSIYAKIIGEDLDVPHPELEVEKIFYAPLLSSHNLSIPEIGEEILIMRESTDVGAKGYYIGRISNSSALNYYPARKYMDSFQTGSTDGSFKYGFSFDIKKLRDDKIEQTPSDEIEALSIPLTFGDVVQQGRSQTYIRHSFNRANKKGVLEQGLCFQEQSSGQLLRNLVTNTTLIEDPSIGETATKNIHFVDSSISKLGDYNLISTMPEELDQGDENSSDRSMMVNMADEIYHISTKKTQTGMYRQILGEKLISNQQETNELMKTMLDGLTGLSETVQVLLNAFIDHEHALPRIDLNLEKTITASDKYIEPARYEQQEPQEIKVSDRIIRIRAGTNRSGNPTYRYANIPGFTRTVERPPKLVRQARTRVQHKSQKINFEAIIGGRENPRFTAPIETNSGDIENPAPLGLQTNKVNKDTEDLIDLFNEQKVHLNAIFNRATDFLSRNQFIN